MSGFALGYHNHVFASPGAVGLSTTPSVGAASDLADMRLSERVTISDTIETAGVATVYFEWASTDSVEVSIQLVGLLNYLATAPGSTSGVQASGTLYFTSGGGGTVTPSVTIWNRPSANFPNHLWTILDDVVEAHTVRISFSASFGAGGGTLTVTAGALWASPIWAPPDGLEATWKQSPIDPGRMGRSPGGQGYPRRRQRLRSFEGRAVHVPFAWAYGDEDDDGILDIQQLLFRVGCTEPIALFPRTRNAAGALSTHVIHRLGIYGCFAEGQLGSIEHLGGDLYQWTGARVDELM